MWDHSGVFKIAPQFHLLTPAVGTRIFEKYSSELIFDYDILKFFYDDIPEDSKDCLNELELVNKNVMLSAPYYQYKTLKFEEKNSLLSEFHKKIKQTIGLQIFKEIENEKCRRND